jgi:hypothetical protein
MLQQLAKKYLHPSDSFVNASVGDGDPAMRVELADVWGSWSTTADINRL